MWYCTTVYSSVLDDKNLSMACIAGVESRRGFVGSPAGYIPTESSGISECCSNWSKLHVSGFSGITLSPIKLNNPHIILLLRKDIPFHPRVCSLKHPQIKWTTPLPSFIGFHVLFSSFFRTDPLLAFFADLWGEGDHSESFYIVCKAGVRIGWAVDKKSDFE